MHLTLRFLGSTTPAQRQSLEEGLAEAAGDSPPLRLQVSGLGVFPDWKSPKVIWMGVKEAGGHLRRLQAEIESMAVREGFRPEKRSFHPHLTLARVKYIRNLTAGVEKIRSHLQSEAGRFEAEEIGLIASELKPEGPVYRTLRTFRLKGVSEPRAGDIPGKDAEK